MVRFLGEHRLPRFNAALRHRCAWAAAVSAFIGFAVGCGKPYRVESDPPGAIVSWKPGTGSPLVTPCEVQPGVHCGVVARFIRVRWDSDVSEWQELDGRSVYRFVQGEASTAPKSGGEAGGKVDDKRGGKVAVAAETDVEAQARIAREQQVAAEAAARAEKDRLERERLEQERQSKERAEQDRLAEERRAKELKQAQRAAEERKRMAEERRRKELAERIARLREDLERIEAELAKPALDAALRRELEAERAWIQAELKKLEEPEVAQTDPAPAPAAPNPAAPSPSPPAPTSPTPGAGGEVGR